MQARQGLKRAETAMERVMKGGSSPPARGMIPTTGNHMSYGAYSTHVQSSPKAYGPTRPKSMRTEKKSKEWTWIVFTDIQAEIAEVVRSCYGEDCTDVSFLFEMVGQGKKRVKVIPVVNGHVLEVPRMEGVSIVGHMDPPGSKFNPSLLLESYEGLKAKNPALGMTNIREWFSDEGSFEGQAEKF